MCDEADGTCPIWDKIKRTARKQHECSGCGETTQRGHQYYFTTSLYDGCWSKWKHCLRCDALYETLASGWKEEFWGPVSVDPHFNCGMRWEDNFGPLPNDVAALAFWLPGDPLPGRGESTSTGNRDLDRDNP